MSGTNAVIAEPPKKSRRKPQPPLAKADALEILRTALVECQRAGIVLAQAPNPRGALLLLSDIDLVNGVFISRDQNAPKGDLPLLIATSGNGGNNEI